MQELREEISKILKEALGEPSVETPLAQSAPSAIPNQSVLPSNQAATVLKPKMVRFNPGTDSEYKVLFSERGFSIDDTRLSFEEIQNALSKNYTITLQGGTVLSPVKMQQILKYKDIF